MATTNENKLERRAFNKINRTINAKSQIRCNIPSADRFVIINMGDIQ